MSYNIGQFRSFDISEYLKEIDLKESKKDENDSEIITEKIKRSSGIDGTSFEDSCVTVNLNTQNNYYLNFKVKRINSLQNINLKVINNEREQILGTFSIPIGSQQFSSFEIVFSVNDVYTKLVWQLVRTLDDYKGKDQNIQNANGRVTTIKANLYTIVDLLASLGNQSGNNSGSLKTLYPGLKYFNKIGIQGPPLMLMSINKQQIRIGKNGIYELNNGINITSIGFVPKNEKDIFIMDFEYQSIKDENPNEQDEEIQGGGE